MHTASLLVPALLALSTSASLLHRAACNADNCYRAVQASSAKPGSSSARKDCSSFMVKTVTPTAATTTSTVTATVTAAASSSFFTQQTAISSTVTAVQTVTNVTTITSTVTVTTPSAVRVSTTIIYPTTVTIGSVLERNEKRDQAGRLVHAPEGYLYIAADDHAKRAAVSSVQVSSSSLSSDGGVPIYASACSGTARYSSACSCAGVMASTVTATRPTSTATTSTTVTIAPPVSIATVYMTTTQQITVTVTQALPVTVATTMSVAVASVYTEVVPVTVATTVIAAPPVCSNFYLQAGPGSTSAGRYAYVPKNADNANVAMTSDQTEATAWMINRNGNVVRTDTGGNPWSSNPTPQFVYSASDFHLGTNFQSLSCAVSTAPNAGSFSCSTTAGSIVLQTCSAFDKFSTDPLVHQDVILSKSLGSCSPLNLIAIPAC